MRTESAKVENIYRVSVVQSPSQMGWGHLTASTVQEKFALKRLGTQTASPVASTEEIRSGVAS